MVTVVRESFYDQWNRELVQGVTVAKQILGEDFAASDTTTSVDTLVKLASFGETHKLLIKRWETPSLSWISFSIKRRCAALIDLLQVKNYDFQKVINGFESIYEIRMRALMFLTVKRVIDCVDSHFNARENIPKTEFDKLHQELSAYQLPLKQTCLALLRLSREFSETRPDSYGAVRGALEDEEARDAAYKFLDILRREAFDQIEGFALQIADWKPSHSSEAIGMRALILANVQKSEISPEEFSKEAASHLSGSSSQELRASLIDDFVSDGKEEL